LGSVQQEGTAAVRSERFAVRASDRSPASFVVEGPDDATVASEFVAWLAERGRSPYTQRTYALGVANLLGWLRREGVELDAVDGAVLRRYIGAFRAGDEIAPLGRAPATVNHRLSALSSFFVFLAERDELARGGGWASRPNPVPAGVSGMGGAHLAIGRDAPRRGRRAELRARVRRRIPRRVEPEVAVALIDAARSWRDRALLTLLWRSGQRIGDWSPVGGRHGLLGLSLGDLDRASGIIVVRLKGARDEHRVPVADDFWPLFARYVREERGLGAPTEPAWIALRRGRGRPLGYATFESQLRALSARIGVHVTAHMFRHALAQALVDVAGVKVAQEVLGHAHMSTTEFTYARVDENAMVQALGRANELLDLQAHETTRPSELPSAGYAFRYDAERARARSDLAPAPRSGRRSVSGGVDLAGLADVPFDSMALAAGVERFVSGLPPHGDRQSRLQFAARSTIAILANLDGGSLQQRWSVLEREHWPRWDAGVDRPAPAERWAWGPATLILARAVRPGWPVLRRVRLTQWLRWVSSEHALLRCHDELERLASAVGWSVGPDAKRRALLLGIRLLLAHGYHDIREITDDDLRTIPAEAAPGVDVLDTILCDLGVLERTPLRGHQRRLRGGRLSPAELAPRSRIPERFREAHVLYLEHYAERVSNV
jgi:integrase/recombinase XerD